MDKFKGKYRIPSNRLQNWDYGWNAQYFITICTQNREYFFGDVINGKMVLSEIGKMAEKYWHEIPEHFPFVKLDAFVVMPNHIHGIIEIAKTDDGRLPSSPPHTQPSSKNKFGPQSKNLASIIRGYKIGVTKNAKKISPGFAWQPNYYDHIIRNDDEYKRIKNYIINNPKKWNDDKFNPTNTDK